MSGRGKLFPPTQISQDVVNSPHCLLRATVRVPPSMSKTLALDGRRSHFHTAKTPCTSFICTMNEAFALCLKLPNDEPWHLGLLIKLSPATKFRLVFTRSFFAAAVILCCSRNHRAYYTRAGTQPHFVLGEPGIQTQDTSVVGPKCSDISVSRGTTLSHFSCWCFTSVGGRMRFCSQISELNQFWNKVF